MNSLASFPILDYIDRLTPTKGGSKNNPKFICPVCNGHNLGINLSNGAYQCFNGCENQEIREAIAPWEERKKSRPNDAWERHCQKKKKPKLKRIDDPIEIATIQPDEWGKAFSVGNKTTYIYSDTQWIERIDKKKDKDFYYHHLDDEGNNHQCKGDLRWFPYGWQFISELDPTSLKDKWCLALEGQKDVETAFTLGLCAVDSRMLDEENLEEIATQFKGIIIIPDHDKTGYQILKRLEKRASQKIDFLTVEPQLIYPEIEEKGDLTDIYNAMNQDKARIIERLYTAIEQARLYRNEKIERAQENQYRIQKTTCFQYSG